MAVPLELIPIDEEERLAAVRRYEILDTPPDGAFERLTAIAARSFRVPISIVSIVDHDRIWFKSAHGLSGVAELPREPGLCASCILQDDVYVVEHAETDPRTLANPLVAGEFGLRFYAGAPLRTADGHNLGTICVIDREPRAVTAEESQTLADLASVVVDELELRLAARRESDRLEQTRTDFVVTASHELRTPLSAVYGAAKTLGRSAGELPDLHRRLVEVIETQSERLNEIVEKISLVGRMERSELALSLETVDAAEAARVSLELVRPVAGERRLTFRRGTVVPRAIGDPMRLRQVLVDLLENAVKYSPDGSAIELGVEQVAGRVRFTVRDEGTGIAPSDHRRIFDKFVRIDPELRTGIPGTGLGLHIVRELVTRMGGTVDVESAPGAGSTFVVDLPAAV